MLESSAARVIILTLDLAGTAVFAISGAAVGVKHRLDIFGVCVLGFIAASAGGMIRDVVIGAVPPAALSDWRYATVSIVAAVVTFWRHPRIERLRLPVLVFDAAGLGLFAVAGTQKALAFGLGPFASAALGMITGIGGGVVRDVLVREIPTVLRSDLYALAALAGSSFVVGGELLGWPPAATAPAGAVLCFAVRLLAIRGRWSLPTAGDAGEE